jgi:hypothetical protein
MNKEFSEFAVMQYESRRGLSADNADPFVVFGVSLQWQIGIEATEDATHRISFHLGVAMSAKDCNARRDERTNSTASSQRSVRKE